MIVYMIAFAIACLSGIAVEDLNLGRFMDQKPRATLPPRESLRNKLSSNIRNLRLKTSNNKVEANRSKTSDV